MRAPKLPLVVDEEDEARRLSACAVHVREVIDDLQGIWFLHLTVYFAGDPYEYLVEAGRSPATLEEIEYRLSVFQARERLRERFLKEVKLEIMQ